MFKNDVGKVYHDGEIIVRQGDDGDAMYVVLEGQVEVVMEQSTAARRLAVLNQGDFFGEMEIFDAALRSATVRAVGDARVLTVDKKTLLRRLQEDPSLALHFLETLSGRLRATNRHQVSASLGQELDNGHSGSNTSG